MANTKKEKDLVDISKVKEELTDYVNIQIQKGFTAELERANKRLIKEKNKKIMKKNIIILLLLILVCYLLYLLYDNRYFDKYIKSETPIVENNRPEEVTPEKEPEKEEITLAELIDEYGYLLNKIGISENSEYIKDYYEGNLTNELKNYLALNNVDFDSLFNEDGSNIIENMELEKYFNELFNKDYKSKTFMYNGVKLKYMNKLESYISDSLLEKSESNIKREIVDIKVEDTQIIITTIEGVIKDKKLFNILTNKEIKAYKKDSLTKYEDKLNRVVYTFEDDKLISILKG